MDNINTATGYFFSQDVIPHEIWLDIFQYLTPAEIANIKLVSQNMRNIIFSEKMLRALLQPIINHLNKLGADIIIVNITNNNIIAVMKNGFDKVNERQMEEIAYLLESHYQNEDIQLVLRNSNMQGPATSMAMLIERDIEIKKINCSLIIPKIGDRSQTELSLKNLGITQFPDSLIQDKDEENQKYWDNLTILNCENNLLIKLPVLLGKCKRLTQLHCSRNQLVSLPDALGDCHQLNLLYCANNRLTFLPESLGACKLENLYCDHNYLIGFPEALFNLSHGYFNLGLQNKKLSIKVIPAEVIIPAKVIIPAFSRLKLNDSCYSVAEDMREDKDKIRVSEK